MVVAQKHLVIKTLLLLLFACLGFLIVLEFSHGVLRDAGVSQMVDCVVRSIEALVVGHLLRD